MSTADPNPHAVPILPVDPGTWREADVPLSERGVRLGWLLNYVNAIYWDVNEPRKQQYKEERSKYEQALAQQRASDTWETVPWVEAVPPRDYAIFELTTRELVAQYIVPFTAATRTPLYAHVPPSERGPPSIFLSHAWDAVCLASAAIGSYGTLDAFGPGIAGAREDFVWIDIVCYNQHELGPDSIAFDMEALVRAIGKVAFAVTAVPLFDRLWCLWELLSVALSNADTRFCVAPTYRTQVRTTVNDFVAAFSSVTKARVTDPRDYDKLMRGVIHHFGSAETADRYIKELMGTRMAHPWFGLHSPRGWGRQ